jgi:hypothetical protein
MILKIQKLSLARTRVSMVRAAPSLADKAKPSGDLACVLKPNALRIVADIGNELSALAQIMILPVI